MDKISLETLTPEQWDVIKEINLFTRNELKFESRELCYYFLLRFCTARKFVIADIKIMLTEYANFYKSVTDRKLSHLNDSNSSFNEIRSLLCIGFSHCDRLGRPILIYRLGQCKFKELWKKYSVDQVIDFYVQLAQRFLNIFLPITSQIHQKRVTKLLTIIDCKGGDVLSFLSGKNNEMVKRLMHMGQNYYPEILGKQYIINAPAMFSIFWSFAKHFLDPLTQERIEISYGVNQKKLIMEVQVENLPKEYGGQVEADLRTNPGPWDVELAESYKLGTFFLRNKSLFQDYFWTKSERRVLDKTMIENKNCISAQEILEINTEVRIRQPKSTKMVVSMNNL